MMKKHPESMFGRILSGRCAFNIRDDGSSYIDRDSSCFQHVLDYLDVGTISDNVIEIYGVQLMQEAEYYMLNGLKELICRFEIVKINVSGREFSTTRRAIRKYPESKLFQMLLGKECHKMSDGSFFIDRDGSYFHEILKAIRTSGTPSAEYDSMSSFSFSSDRNNQLNNEFLFYFGCSIKEFRLSPLVQHFFFKS